TRTVIIQSTTDRCRDRSSRLHSPSTSSTPTSPATGLTCTAAARTASAFSLRTRPAARAIPHSGISISPPPTAAARTPNGARARRSRRRLPLTHPRRRPRDPPLLHVHLPRPDRRGQVVHRRPRLTQLCLRPPHVHRLLPHREQLGHVRAGQPLDQVGEHPLVEQ